MTSTTIVFKKESFKSIGTIKIKDKALMYLIIRVMKRKLKLVDSQYYL